MTKRNRARAASILLLGLLVAGLGLAGSAEAEIVDTEYAKSRVHLIGCDFEETLYGWNGTDCPSSAANP